LVLEKDWDATGIEWHRNHPRKEDSKHVGPKLSTKTTLEQVIANKDTINGDAEQICQYRHF